MLGLSRILELSKRTGFRRATAFDWLNWDQTKLQSKKRGLTFEELEGRIVPTLLGQQLFPTDYPWNQNISNAPVAANSAAIISHIGTNIGIHPDWGQDSSSNGASPLYGIPLNVVHGNTTAKINVIIDNYPGESDILPVPIPANAVLEGDFQNGPNTAGGGYNTGQRGDSHLIIWDEDNNIAYELYGVTRPSDATLFPNTSGTELPHSDNQWHAAQETVWNMNTNTFRQLGDTSADAAGLSILAGLARPDEGLPVSQGGQGAIDHALRFTLPSGDVAPQYIYPASHMVSTSTGSTKLPLGSRLRLQNTPAVNAIISTLGPEAQIIAHALQQYGLVLADIGSAMYVSGSSAAVNANNAISLTWNMNDVLGLSALKASDFDVVNLTPVVSGLSSTSGSAGNTLTITGQNFSGSAGHLAVFFGSTAATSVTLVDDSHIAVVVPAGSGSVNVTVQSGVKETDPNNPSDNVNNPIFGYGTSALSSADQFTFSSSSPTVSSTNSLVSLAASNLASGSTDLVTITVKDTSNNPISGLSNSAFSFSMSGGTSAGTFGTVSATSTAGVYTVVLTGTTAGTASNLQVSVNGVVLSTKPSVTVNPGPVSASNSSDSFAASSVTTGNTDLLTIVVKDAAGNAITGLLNSAFGFSLSGGTSDGTFGTVSESSTRGTYSVQFTGGTIGTASTLALTVSGVILNSKPTITVTSGSNGNQTPTINPIVTQNVADGSTLSLTVTASATANPPITYGLGANAPAGANINPQTGLFTWQPSEWNGIEPGSFTVTVTAALTNNTSLSSTASFTVNVGASSTIQGRGSTSRNLVELGLVQSAEYYSNFITAAYQKYLGRSPDKSGLANWISQMQHGLTDEQLEANFIGSPEYIANHGGAGAGWIKGMYVDLLGRSPSASEVQGWVNQLNAGVSTTQIAYGFAASQERESQRIVADYQTYLGRSPSQAEINMWINDFLHGTTNEQVIAGFVSSNEYFQMHSSNIVDWLFAAFRASLQRAPKTSEYQSLIPQLQ
ncbi:DUF4214 domain-containing protein [Telmatocola sphagniphila]|uniref:DUF4214 domain-containing protein n=1 Tax=Telmatocola sphagniphila TaxID=1123043 RepID=A0A8E6B578_9BACT|nr:DUF4214 domain-containing protein [Telmatocola sphagniphila]QVL30723.1 DUF4214 domain-containing protein [Telmatocola sphagniphila]